MSVSLFLHAGVQISLLNPSLFYYPAELELDDDLQLEELELEFEELELEYDELELMLLELLDDDDCELDDDDRLLEQLDDELDDCVVTQVPLEYITYHRSSASQYSNSIVA